MLRMSLKDFEMPCAPLRRSLHYSARWAPSLELLMSLLSLPPRVSVIRPSCLKGSRRR